MEDSVMYDYNIVCIGQKERTVYEAFESWTRPYLMEWSALWAVKGRWYQFIFDYERSLSLAVRRGKCYVIVREDADLDLIERSLLFYLERSPIHKVFVLFRLQGNRHESFLGELSLGTFMRRLKQGQIKANVAYLIAKYAW